MSECNGGSSNIGRKQCWDRKDHMSKMRNVMWKEDMEMEEGGLRLGGLWIVEKGTGYGIRERNRKDKGFEMR
jgi:hypothetical protein